MISRSTESRRRNAFTLIELLVVIGIIVILLAILIPVAGRVRIHAQTAKTSATMTAIASACERYFAMEHAYPGLCSNAQLAAGVPVGFTGASGGGTELTSSENCVASLSGGIMPDTTGNPNFTTIIVDSTTTIGKGPMHFGPVAMNRTRSTAYVEGPVGALLPPPPYSSSGCAALAQDVVGTTPTTKDSFFPEYTDGYSQPRPIIYLRANNNAPGCATVMSQKNPSPIAQYTTYEFNYYKRGAAPTNTDFPGDFMWGQVIGDFEFYANENEYLRVPTMGTNGNIATYVPRGRDKFILISAGPDRCFGTKDDIFYGGQ
jgi:prepilin-type N-terminal cleavage/methylation domain-containing protein